MMAANDVNIKLKAVDETKAAFQSVDNSLGGLKNAVFSVQSAIASIITGSTVGFVVNANKSFQTLEASLVTFTGSTEKATQAFDALSQFAAATPFGLEEVVGGFNKLIARGIAPTIEQLTSFGNIASGTGKSLDQFIEAIADASVGEFERLKEFGIKANQEGNNVKMTFGGVTTSISKDSNSIIEYLTKLGDTKFAGGMERQANTIAGVFSGLRDSLVLLSIEIGKSGLNEFIVDTTKSLTKFVQAWNDATKAGLGFFDTIDLNKTIAEVGADSAIVKYTDRLWQLQDALKGDKAFFKGAIQAEIDSITRKLAILKGETSENVELPEITVTSQKIVEELRSVSQAYDAVGQAIAGSDLIKAQNLAQSVEKLDELFFNGAINADLYESAMKKLTNTTSTKGADATQALRDYAMAAQDVGKSMVSLQLGAIRSLEDSFIGLINGTMSVKDAFSSMATSIVNDLIRIMVQQSITGPIAQALGYSNPYMGMMQQGTPSGDFVGPLPARAIGGPVQAGQPYMVGERGPEMFVPSQGGSIVPNGDMSGGGVVVNQTINVTTGVQQTVRAEIMSLMPQISNAAKAAVADAKLRGGSYGKMMA